MAAFENDIFISYSSKDYDWAIRIHDSLKKEGKNIFLDKVRLIPGKRWEDQLHDGLEKSEHMILLWSDKAKASGWVNKEGSFFDVTNYKNPQRKLIVIVLNDDPEAYSSLELITDIKDQQLYDTGADQVNEKTWDIIIQKTLSGIKISDNTKPIRRVILTLKDIELGVLNFDLDPPFGESLNKLGLTKEKIENCYGPLRTDWKPFGSKKNVVAILNEILDEINKKYKLSYKWISVDDNNLRDRNKLEIEKAFLEKDPSVIIVDPIALYDATLKETFLRLIDCLQNKNALVMTFPLFEPPSAYTLWRKPIEFLANNFHARYFQPPIPKDNIIGNFTVNPLDRLDARHFIQHMLSDMNLPGYEKIKNPVLSQ